MFDKLEDLLIQTWRLVHEHIRSQNHASMIFALQYVHG